MKLIAYISIWIALAVAFSIAAQAQEEDLYTVTPVSGDQVLLNRLEPRLPRGFEIAESIPVRLLDGPWDPNGLRARVDAYSLASEQLARMNYPKKSPIYLAPRQNRIEKFMDSYDLNIQRENPCGVLIDRINCLQTEPIYKFSAKLKREF